MIPTMSDALEPIKYHRGSLEIINQLLLPIKIEYVKIYSIEDGWNAIKLMQVRGAPAIAVVGCLSIAVVLFNKEFKSEDELRTFVIDSINYLVTARPTAVNIARAANDIKLFLQNLLQLNNIETTKLKIIEWIEAMMKKDVDDNVAMGNAGASHILQTSTQSKVTILTHCNTGSLATVGYGTALGVIRSLYSQNQIKHVFCTETRPYNQGARLTAFELVYEKIPATLIADSAVSLAMKKHGINAVVVGADRIAANGDTANKIGTYQLAIAAKYHGIPFYVAAPSLSIDFNMADGDGIVIEERNQTELSHSQGNQVAATGIKIWNPAFDVTPAALITGGIVTEKGVFRSDCLEPNLFS